MSQENKSINKELSNTTPPPPPPISLRFKNKKNELSGENSTSTNKIQNLEDDLRDFMCKVMEEMRVKKKPFVFNYRYLTPILQDGPNCGLAALSMVTSCKKEIMKLEEIFKYSKARGFSNNGEMFSVNYMAEIAQTLIGCDIEILNNGLEREEYIFTQILSGALLLVPYDADFNHSPCKKKGHRAHWAVISGLILEGEHLADSVDKQEELKSIANCIQYLPNEGTFILQNISKACNPNKVYVLARQGKSIHPAVWKYRDLKDSNENLVEFDPSRAESDTSYILPPDGVEGGLKGKAVLLKGLTPISGDEIMNCVNILRNFF